MINLDSIKLHQTNPTMRMIIIGMICCAVFLMGYLFDMADLRDKTVIAGSQESDLIKAIAISNQRQTYIRSEISRLPTLNGLIALWEEKLVRHEKMPDILNDILHIGASNQLQIISFNPSPETKTARYFKVPIKMEAVGTYNQIAGFLSQIANMPKLIALEDFTMTAEEVKAAQPSSGNLVNIAIDMNVYFLPDNNST